MAEAGQILSLFDQKDLVEIKRALMMLPDATNSGTIHHAYTNGFSPGDRITPFIKHRVIRPIEQKLGKKLSLTHGMLMKETTPWQIHTDYIKEDSNPDMALAIPLNTDPMETHTVIFNEESQVDFDNGYINTHETLEKNARYLYNDLCSHCDEHKLGYVSVRNIYKWHPGSVIYWDRKLLHCSDNFLRNNIKTKIGLVIFTHD